MEKSLIHRIKADLAEWFRAKVLNLDRVMSGQMTLVVPPVIQAVTVGELLAQYPKPSQLAVVISSQILGASIDQIKNSAVLFEIKQDGLNPMPSADVFLKLMQYYTEVQAVIVGTQWGLWVVNNDYNRPSLYLSTNDVLLRQQIQTALDQVETARFKLSSGAIKSYRDLDDDNVGVAFKTIRELSDITNVRIALYDWDNLLDLGSRAIRIPVPIYDVIPTRTVV